MSFISISLKLIDCRTFFIGIFFLLTANGFAQINQTGRIEIPLRGQDSDHAYSVVSAPTGELVVYSHRLGDDKDQLEITSLDTTLSEVFKGYIAIDKYLQSIFTKISDSTLYILLKYQNPGKTDFVLVTLDLITRNYKTFIIKNYIVFQPTEFLVVRRSILVGGYFNYRPFVLRYSTDEQRPSVLPGLSNERGELIQVKSSDNGSVDIVINAKNIENKKCLWIRNYDNTGSLIRTTVLEPEKGKDFVFGRIINAPGEGQVIAGGYGKSGGYSRGLFIASINLYGEYSVRYYNFADLQNFFKYMKAKKETRIKKRIERRKIEGKKIKFNYRLIADELVPYGDEYVLLGEAFYPVYRSVVSPGLTGTSRTVFDGYQYTHAIVIGFSKSGKLLWDNSFEINDVKSYQLERFVKIHSEANHISLLYLFQNTIRSKVIKGAEVLEGKTSEPIKMNWPADKISKSLMGFNKLEYWFPEHFYAYGVQEITNLGQSGAPIGRRVFFINKIVDK